jgi:7-cyano-7-deazaguanine synthase
MPSKVLVLHSGGLDSTVCLYEAAASGHHVVSLGIDYGQKHIIELYFARRQCDSKNIQQEVVHVSWVKPERPIPLDRGVEDIKKDPSTAFLPGRNLLFLALASAHAAGVRADEIWTGINSIDFSGYPDCTPAFFEAYRAVHRIGVGETPIIRAPLLQKSKPEIAARAKELGLSSSDTWSCYRPQILSGALVPCARCDACQLHAYAWQHVK